MRGGVLDEPLHDFLHGLLPDRPATILGIEEEAARTSFPIVGPLVGRLLETTARAVSAKRVLEMGSGFGYSAYWFSRALPPGGELVWTDAAEDNERRAREVSKELFPHVAMTFLRGDALASARAQTAGFDVVFVDVDKHEYPQALAIAKDKVRIGGAIVFDNVLWSRRVFPGGDHAAKSTAGVLGLLEALRADDSLATSIVPLRDGVSVSIRLR
jgi:caffeoyl-CoA O-methyltransferase